MAYKRKFGLFLAFLVALGLSLPQVSTLDVLAFMEYLLQSGMSAANITNHLAAIRSMLIIYNCDASAFRDQRIPLFIKAVKINRPLQPAIKSLIDEHILLSMVLACDTLPNPVLFKALYLFSFFSFLRLSNILPHTTATFDPSRHLCVGDLIFSDQAVVVVLKWSKTLQDRVKVATISISALGQSKLCPWRALRDMLDATSPLQDLPLFQVPSSDGQIPLTDSVARKHLKDVSRCLGFHKSFTFHDFRHGGATWAFRHGVPLQDIQAQGTWSSSCVWRYIQLPSSHNSPVAASFRAHLSV